jgi:hypothetical protein
VPVEEAVSMNTPTEVACQQFVPVSLAELTAQALAADPDAPVAADAVPFGSEVATSWGLLPSWYMPGPATYHRRSWHRLAVFGVIASFLLINGLGLCITYGHLVPA